MHRKVAKQGKPPALRFALCGVAGKLGLLCKEAEEIKTNALNNQVGVVRPTPK